MVISQTARLSQPLNSLWFRLVIMPEKKSVNRYISANAINHLVIILQENPRMCFAAR